MPSRKYLQEHDALIDIMNRNPTDYRKKDHIPLSLVTIRERLQHIKKDGKRLLVIKNPYTEPENIAVVTLDKFYPRFVLGHYTNISGVKIPYTLSYATVLDKNSKYTIKVEGEN